MCISKYKGKNENDIPFEIIGLGSPTIDHQDEKTVKPQIKSIKNIAKKKNFKGAKTVKIKKAIVAFKVKHSMIKKKAKLYFRV